MDVRSSSKRRRRRLRRANLPVGGDLISGLTDDLLVRILELVPDARDVVRTDALSRRWHGMWTGVAALRFDFDSWSAVVRREAGAAEQYLAFVDDALALRAKATTARCYGAVKDLTISFDIADYETEELVPLSFKAARGWICYAVQHGVKSLVLDLDLDLPRRYLDGQSKQADDAVALDDLASSANLETLHLVLGGAKLRLPSSTTTVVFSSLTDVSLKDTMVAGHLLSRLMSAPCCPRLRKLQLTDLRFSIAMEESLFLEGDALLELSLDDIQNMRSLELKTPSLRVLHVKQCFDLDEFTVSAPKLEDLKFKAEVPLRIVDVHDHLSSVGTLKIQLRSHGEDYDHEDRNGSSFDLLQRCRSTKDLKVSLELVEKKYREGDIIKGRIPPLTHVTSLAIHATLWEPHSFSASIASVLAQCNNIKYLSLKLSYLLRNKEKDFTTGQYLLCDDSCQWKSHEFSLAHLQEVEFKKLVGTDCEFQFIQSILARETGIQKVTISFDPSGWFKDKEGDAFKLITPLLDGGLWTRCNDIKLLYKWRRCC